MLDLIQQAAAIPIRYGRICLVTSSGGHRWIIPKGHLEPGRTARQMAAQEAWEEAGLEGWLEPKPVGSFEYEKCGRFYVVKVFLMQVSRVAEDWPEAGLRERMWLPAGDAHRYIEQPSLRRLLRRMFAQRKRDLCLSA